MYYTWYHALLSLLQFAQYLFCYPFTQKQYSVLFGAAVNSTDFYDMLICSDNFPSNYPEISRV